MTVTLRVMDRTPAIPAVVICTAPGESAALVMDRTWKGMTALTVWVKTRTFVKRTVAPE